MNMAKERTSKWLLCDPFNNVLLIASQAHDATRVAGFNAWKKFGLNVRKGEKAIFILAPMIYKVADENILDKEIIR